MVEIVEVVVEVGGVQRTLAHVLNVGREGRNDAGEGQQERLGGVLGLVLLISSN